MYTAEYVKVTNPKVTTLTPTIPKSTNFNPINIEPTNFNRVYVKPIKFLNFKSKSPKLTLSRPTSLLGMYCVLMRLNFRVMVNLIDTNATTGPLKIFSGRRLFVIMESQPQKSQCT